MLSIDFNYLAAGLIVDILVSSLLPEQPRKFSSLLASAPQTKVNKGVLETHVLETLTRGRGGNPRFTNEDGRAFAS